MSSPAPSGGGAPLRPLGKAAPVSRRERDEANNTRAMALKVLYNIDDENNTNCLARWPDILSVHTAAIDEKNVIGVAELKTCIQAVIQSSPEILSKVGQDYTVYAYDYSESDTPQSGQGMLSWALAENAQSQLVTGRVCKNILGLFSKGVQETLEVKLRLVPVVTSHQNEYLSSVEKSRQSSNQADNNEWNTMRSQSGLAQMNRSFSAQTVSANHVDGVSREEFTNIMNPSGTMMVGGRASTPGGSIMGGRASPLNATNRGKGKGSQAKTSRPSSASGVKRPRGRPPKNPVIQSDMVSGSEDVGTDGEEGPSRKRIRPSEADRNISSTFGDPESLRIRASTAASIRGDMRPRPGNLGTGNGLQELPRAPTPVPNLPPHISTRGPAFSRSSLRRESVQSPGQYVSPYSDAPVDSGLGSEQIHQSIESAMSSPERHDSPAQSPPDIASSPPVLTSHRASMQPPSSPDLPQMRRRGDDSAYGGSGGLCGEEDEDDDMCMAGPGDAPQQTTGAIEEEGQFHMTRPTSSYSNFEGAGNSKENEFDVSCQLSAPEPPNAEGAPSVQSREGEARISGNCDPSTAKVRAASFSGALTLPNPVDGDPSSTANMSYGIMQPANWAPPQPTKRSQTAGPSTTQETRATSEPRAGGARNKAKADRILSKLEQSVATGTEPDFCQNCGTLKTPTWRKAFIREIPGDPGFIEHNTYSDEPGRTMTIQILTRDLNTNTPTSYRIWKKSLADHESFSDFIEVMLCNPCGIWVAKHKSHRPPEHWDKPRQPKRGLSLDQTDADEPPKKKTRMRGKRRVQEKKQSKGANTNPTSEAPAQSEANIYSDWQSEANPQSDANLHSDFNSNYRYPPPPFPSEFRSDVNYPQSEGPGAAMSPPIDDNSENTRGQGQIPAPGPNSMRQDLNQVGQGPHSMQMNHGAGPSRGRQALGPDRTGQAWGPNHMTHSAADHTGQGPDRTRHGSRDSPIEIGNDFGETRRLLFPSPRKDGSPKLLSDSQVSVVINVPQPAMMDNFQGGKEHLVQDNVEALEDKENIPGGSVDQSGNISEDLFGESEDLFGESEDLFGEESPARPVTPTRSNFPPNPFKTPTRPTPNHRPLTRSQSKNRSQSKSVSVSAPMATFQTPSKTPAIVTPRRSPRNLPDVLDTPGTFMDKVIAESLSNMAADSQVNTGSLSNIADAPTNVVASYGFDFDFLDAQDEEANWAALANLDFSLQPLSGEELGKLLGVDDTNNEVSGGVQNRTFNDGEGRVTDETTNDERGEVKSLEQNGATGDDTMQGDFSQMTTT